MYALTGAMPALIQTILVALVCASLPMLGVRAAELSPLTLVEAERLALELDAGSMELEDQGNALRERAVADGQLPDPELAFGAVNFPTDTFDFGQEAMTKLELGFRQQFPPGDTRALRRQRGDTLADATDQELEDRRLQVVREVRRLWLERYFAEQGAVIVAEEEAWFERLEEAVTAAYAAGGRRQHDIVRIQLENELLREKRIGFAREVDVVSGELGRWLGEAARRPLPDRLPAWPITDEYSALVEAIESHPALAADRARIAAGELEESLALQRYKPQWGLGVSYGARSGSDPTGKARPDLVTAVVTFSLPVFTDKRQDRRRAAAAAETRALKNQYRDRQRQFQGAVESWWARWQKLDELVTHYDADVLPTARANVDATLQAYQNDTAIFDELVRAEELLLVSRLKVLQLTVDRAAAQAELAYLAGEMP